MNNGLTKKQAELLDYLRSEFTTKFWFHLLTAKTTATQLKELEAAGKVEVVKRTASGEAICWCVCE